MSITTRELASRPYTTEEGTPERRLEVSARLADIQAVKDAEVNTSQPVTGSAITSHDFHPYTTDKDRDRWTAGRLRHVIAALEGRRCILVADNQTGHSLIGARLRGLRQTPGYGTYQYLVEWEYEPGKTQSTWHRVESLGPVIISMDAPLKYAALELARQESTAAVTAARAALPECTYGAWKAEPGPDYVMVRFAPQKDDGGPESAIRMDITRDGFRAGKVYHYRGCSK